jgi:transposase
MAKYSLAFKLRVVRDREQGLFGSRTIAARFGIDHGTVEKWCAVYQLHGEKGLMKRHRRYSSAFKAAVLHRMASEGWSIRQTCAIFDIPAQRTLQQWQRAFAEGGMAALEPKRRGRRPKMAKNQSHTRPLPQRRKAPKNITPEEINDELEYLRAENDYLKKLKALAQEKRSAEKKKRD